MITQPKPSKSGWSVKRLISVYVLISLVVGLIIAFVFIGLFETHDGRKTTDANQLINCRDNACESQMAELRHAIQADSAGTVVQGKIVYFRSQPFDGTSDRVAIDVSSDTGLQTRERLVELVWRSEVSPLDSVTLRTLPGGDQVGVATEKTYSFFHPLRESRQGIPQYYQKLYGSRVSGQLK